jgi:protein translocase SecG subunit
MNTMTQILPWIQVILSALLVFLVLIQRGGAGIEGGALGGSASNMTYFSRRGSEKFIFLSTIVVAVLFAVSALIPLILG